jgi:hypothetical protein
MLSEEYKKIYESVWRFGDPVIWTEDGINELHSYHRDLSIFWQFHRKLHKQELPSFATPGREIKQ